MKKKGFTLLEIMIALTIFSTFSVFMYRFFADEQKSIIAKHRQMDMHYSALMVMDYIESTIRNNPGLLYDSNVVYKDSTKAYGLINVTGTNSPVSDYYFESTTKSFKDKGGNTISQGIESISISVDSLDMNLINVEITMSYGSGARELRYNLKNTINIKR